MLASKHISSAKNFRLVFISIEFDARITIAPALQLEVIHLDLFRRMVINELWVCFPVNAYFLFRDDGIVLVELLVQNIQALHF